MPRFLRWLVMSVLFFTLTQCASQNKKVEVPTTHKLQSIYYDFDRSLIRADMEPYMEGNASYLKQNQNARITVEGHCDNRGTNEYNMALGHRRAESAKGYLANMGIDSSRMQSVSYGEERPVCFERNEYCWQKSRRADFR